MGSLPFLIIITTTIIIIIHSPSSVHGNEQYITCNTTFSCGGIQDVGYPFWESERRPSYCGFPGFELNCSTGVDQSPEITIVGQTYKVDNISSSSNLLTISRTDYVTSLCPTSLKNTTLVDTLFTLSSNTEPLYLYYGCQFLSSQLNMTFSPFQFTCDVIGPTNTGFYLPANTSSLTSTNLAFYQFLVAGCASSVYIPVSQSRSLQLMTIPNVDSVVTAIREGFGLNWDANNSLCESCMDSGGVCGYDTERNMFNCHCPDQTYLTTCHGNQTRTSGGNSRNLSVGLGIGIGGVGVIFILLGCWLFLMIRRRKRKVALAVSKDISGPPSSKSLRTPITNFSQSIPSYPSLKSDLEKGSAYFGVQVFSYAELETATDNFDSSKELGDGGFGTVYYGVLSDGSVVAVKRLHESSNKRVEQFMNEVEILARLRHKNLVTLYGCTSKHSRDLLLVYEYIPNGTVADHLLGKQTNSGLLSWPVRLSIAIETAEALAYLHELDVIHRDVKTNNILLDNNFHVKVADFGLSRLFPTNVTHVSTAPQGTPGYVDPEYYRCYHLTDKSDVYSFGVVLIELISSLPAVDTNRHRHDINLANMAINKIQNHALHELVDPMLGFEKDFVVRRMITSVAELAFRCLQQERDMRPSMEEVRGILRGIENETFGGQKAEVVDIGGDDVGLINNSTPPFSPDSIVADKWDMEFLRRTT
ncbi:serine/threonine-protein kinase [Tripterygium wilfordii]|uniref:non-specific serine/threonine protein kinase n=1 Tax=Tripterygium wilfordii TaxID=458696 RepID=A0A7J7DVM0_TRIWF|nr:LEAF RUST 10 DISEASE-RESISTANCE LOCUS RECEPTOR-LIKE PROTEIN KINASE-like 1.4 isoform X2 [Tripterygium wilfordii]XP_038691726.1 LEAF RUST 10 DISEASE-RESISTANCE LOCUS RECEPTOR-LIKE PROTEIN KINASE-like 1.4 isoform X2 [Tripterygium wilfordii]XP_038691734.1 LEAF RUST 10 DISEASE-RESISTANCE LOCUS RECEPTOR-LIKE PROTEIN KINASE-like 1.4 isoform X2 [Tripterygium wilfordii]KAF5750166.1 serine/threonine-protein kinase [Tripterygium wilfordii]